VKHLFLGSSMSATPSTEIKLSPDLRKGSKGRVVAIVGFPTVLLCPILLYFHNVLMLDVMCLPGTETPSGL